MPRLSRRYLLHCGTIVAAGTATGALVSCGETPVPAPTPPPSPTRVPPTTVPTQSVGAVTATTVPAVVSPTLEVVDTTPEVVDTTPEVVPTATVEPEVPAAPEAEAVVGPAYLGVAHGPSPAAITTAAIDAIGGIGRFVRDGDDVIVKPNMCVAYHGPEYAATTNPEVVATIVSLCLGVGAKRVRVMDYPFGGSASDAYVITGMAAAVEAAGGQMALMSGLEYGEVDFPEESVDLRTYVVYKPALEADVLIDVPIAKHHGSAVLTLGAKNLMGLIEDRGIIHVNLHQRIADLLALFRPHLTVMDAVRILVAHGPSGGNLDDVRQMNTVIASHDTVAVDAYTTRFFDFADTDKVQYIKLAAGMGLGTLDLDSIDIREVEVA